MKIIAEKNGNIYEYYESFWTGRKTVYVNGVKYSKVNKTYFEDENGSSCLVLGNFMTGVKLSFDEEMVHLGKLKWYEMVLSYLTLIAVPVSMVYGKSESWGDYDPVTLFSIGSGLAAFFAMLFAFISLAVFRSKLNNLLKYVIAISIIALSALCAIGYFEIAEMLWHINN